MAGYSIYLQQDKFTVTDERVTMEKVTTSDQSCLERWDYLRVVNQETRNYQVIANNQKLNVEFFKLGGCADSFRDWMPKIDSDWDFFVDWEINKKSRCELYLKGELKVELYGWIETIMRANCEDFLKQ